MADYTIPSKDIGVYEIPLAAGVEKSVEFQRDLSIVEVTALSADHPVYFTVDKSAPTIAGANCYSLLPGTNSAQVDVTTDGNTIVRLISAGAATVNVSRT
jgi:hypothetical protein